LLIFAQNFYHKNHEVDSTVNMIILSDLSWSLRIAFKKDVGQHDGPLALVTLLNQYPLKNEGILRKFQKSDTTHPKVEGVKK
jgi:hypothetical protein